MKKETKKQKAKVYEKQTKPKLILKKVKQQTAGITLIALVITIIVLLILAAVSIATLTGENGILTQASTAKEETRGASVEEAKNLWKVNQETNNYTKEETEQTLEELVQDLGPQGQNLLTQEEVDKIIGDEEKGIEATWQVKIGSRTIVFKEPSVVDYIKIGDYIEYDPTKTDVNRTQNVEISKLTYTSPVGGYSSAEGKITHGNGALEQTFTAKKLSELKWRVISISEHKVELIADTPIQTDANQDFYLAGGIGYLYAEQELNEICKIYGYGYGANTDVGASYTIGGPKDTVKMEKISGTGARSITVEDINKIAQITEADIKTFNPKYGNRITLATEVYYPILNSSNITYPGQSIDKITEIKYTDYNCGKGIIKDTTMQNMLWIGEYWISSRATSDTGNFYVRYMWDLVGLTSKSLCIGSSSKISGQSSSKKVCPLVTLKADVIDVSSSIEVSGSESVMWKLK